jgi:hypothetical protein
MFLGVIERNKKVNLTKTALFLGFKVHLSGEFYASSLHQIGQNLHEIDHLTSD